ncbi:glycosyltransferase family A protein [Planktotalea sp.]|uniref:glycosyltransferase family 2 protein n=1 Tax=Planktotalea sp. TaxID=2029877 RepID=UPI003296D6E3
MTSFAIIIPCFNAERTLAATLDSIRSQSHGDWSVLCVDDGSSDTTRAIVQHFNKLDGRISLVINDGKGPSCARNMGAFENHGADVIAFCDADDLWAPEKLAQLQSCFADTSVDAGYGQIAFFQDSIADAQTVSTVPQGDLTIEMLLAENPVCTMSNIAVRTDLFRATGGFDTEMVHNEDLDWLIRLVGGGARVLGVNALQTYYRTNPNGLSSDLEAMTLGRRKAIETAARFGVVPSRSSNAIYDRYLARRALRLGHGRLAALGFALRGVFTSPLGFFNSPKRGALTLSAALLAVVLPTGLTRALFSR